MLSKHLSCIGTVKSKWSHRIPFFLSDFAGSNTKSGVCSFLQSIAAALMNLRILKLSASEVRVDEYLLLVCVFLQIRRRYSHTLDSIKKPVHKRTQSTLQNAWKSCSRDCSFLSCRSPVICSTQFVSSSQPFHDVANPPPVLLLRE